MTTDLFGIVITNGVAVGILANTVNGTGHVKQALSQGGLTAAAVAQKADIANGVCCVHNVCCSFREAEPPLLHSGAQHRTVSLYTNTGQISMPIFIDFTKSAAIFYKCSPIFTSKIRNSAQNAHCFRVFCLKTSVSAAAYKFTKQENREQNSPRYALY